MMRPRESPPPTASIHNNSAGKLILSFFEPKPLIATLLFLTLLMFVLNFQPYLLRTFSPYAATTAITFSQPITLSHLLGNKNLPYPYPNKRLFDAYGHAAFLFVKFGAYRGSPNSFAVIGLASKPIHVFHGPSFRCEWLNKDNRSTVGKAQKFLPDWGFGRVYTAVVVNCTFDRNPNADNSGGRLVVHAMYGNKTDRHEKFVALEEKPGSYNESVYDPPYKYDYLYCGSSLFGNLSAPRIREWMAYHAWFFGPKTHFVLHDAGGMGPEVRAVLEPWVKLGRVTIQDVRDQEDYDGFYYNQFVIVNDCLFRHRHAANWTFFFDVDEYLYLPEGNSLESVLDEFSDYTQFTIEQNPMSPKLCLNDSSQDVSKLWGFEKLTFRDTKFGIWRDRKYVIQARNALAAGVHMSEAVVGKTLHDTETRIRYYHYHRSIAVREEVCREFVPFTKKDSITWYNKIPFVYDDKMKALGDQVRQFEEQMIGSVNAGWT